MGWIFLIGLILTIGIELGAEFLFFSKSKKEDQEELYITRTHAPRRRMITAFVLTVGLSVASVLVAVDLNVTEKSIDLGGWIAYSLSCLFMITLALIIFLISASEYEILTQDGIIIHRIRKKTFVSYDQMLSYLYSFDQLTVYGENDQILFLIADGRIGLQSIIRELDARGIRKR